MYLEYEKIFLIFKTILVGMFRALSVLSKEDAEGFQTTDHSEFVKSQTSLFNNQQPNLQPSDVKGLPESIAKAASGLMSFDVNTRQSSLRDIDVAKQATSVQTKQELLNANQQCVTSDLEALRTSQNPGQRVRCGWIQQKGNPGDQPRISQGNLGTKNGPIYFENTPKGVWYWNLDDAKKAVLTDRCQALKSCANVGAPNQASCAFTTEKNIGVPAENGRVLYPDDTRLSASAASLVFSPGACPAPPPVGTPQYELARSRDVCTPLPDGRLSRDCMLQQFTAAGCKTDSTLQDQLTRNALPQNYAAGLADTSSQKIYQSRSSVPLLDNVVRDGQTTTATALSNFKELAKQASTVDPSSALNVAARDLCTQKGVMETQDFCSELTDSSVGPFDLNCLQKEFRRGGGQPAGSLQPTAANKSQWDGLRTWGRVKDRIAQLNGMAQGAANDDKIQRQGLLEFLGIRREAVNTNQIPPIQGIEHYWFNRKNNTFIGRRILGGATSDFPRFSTGGIIENTKLADMVEQVAAANIRPSQNMSVKLKVEADDGFIQTLNLAPNDQNNNIQSTRGGFQDWSNENPNSTDLDRNVGLFGANIDQPPTAQTTNTCWKLVKNGPNYIVGHWQESYGGAHSQIQQANCGQQNFQPFPAETITLQQEPDAPMMSFQGVKKEYQGGNTFSERRFPSYFFVSNIINGRMMSDYKYKIPNLQNTALSFGVNKNIHINSWRTLTMAFYLDPNRNKDYRGDGGLMFQGPLIVKVVPNGTNYQVEVWWWMNGFLTNMISVNTKISPANTPVAESKPQYVSIIQRSVNGATQPNQISISHGYFDQFKSGEINIRQAGPNTLVQTAAAACADYTNPDAAFATLMFPGAEWAWVRFFDQEHNQNDVMRDLNNEWLMKQVPYA